MKEKFIQDMKETIPYLIAIVVIILIRTYIISPIRVDGPSMNNTLSNNDLLFLKKYEHDYERYNIIVFKFGKDKLIKRVIGLPGEEIEIKNNLVYINGEVIEEPYLDEENLDSNSGDMEKITVPAGTYFVMGDNRRESFDSRYFGPISKNQIFGVADFRIYPINKFGNVNK